MKIKTKKKLNLPELIQYIMDNEELKGLYYVPTPLRGGVKISKSGEVLVENVWADDTFTVEVEEELTEETEIRGATFVYYDELKREIKPFRYADVTSLSLEHIIQTRPDTVALAVFRGKQLIWTRDLGIPAGGVLEVSE